jgi:stage III sporulation protein AE
MTVPVCAADSETYDYGKIDDAIKEYSDTDISFQQIIDGLTDDSMNIRQKGAYAVFYSFKEVFKSSKSMLVKILVLAFLSALLNNFGTFFNKEQVKDVAQMMITISLSTILLTGFIMAVSICDDILESCIGVYKAIVPVFFSAVAFTSGSTTAAVYYEIVLLMITFVNIFMKNVIVKFDEIYILISLADSVTKEKRFSRVQELIEQVIRWCCKTALVAFTGLGGIKGMVVTTAYSQKRSILLKTLKVLPGVGSSFETVTETVVGAGCVIKNGIGMAAIIALVIVCMIPVLKLVAMSFFFKAAAAVIEPLSDKRIVGCVNSLATAMGLLNLTAVTSVSLFMLMSALIVALTGF